MNTSTMHRRRRLFRPTATIGLLTAALIAGVVTGPNAALAAVPAGDGTTVEVEDITLGPDGQPVHTRHTERANLIREATLTTKADGAAGTAAVSKVSKRLSSMAAVGATDAAGLVTVMVTFADDQELPRFPDYDQGQPATAAKNLAARAQADALVRDLTTRREPGYRALRADFAALGGRVRETYWLTKSVLADVPLSAVPSLASRADVRYVEPNEHALVPADNSERAARALLGTDPYFTSGRAADRVAILDTGVQSDAFLMSNPSMLGVGFDFTADGNAFLDRCDHGTKTAGVIAANSNLGDPFRGISAIRVNNYKIMTDVGVDGPKCEGAANSGTLGFQLAVQNLEKVIVGAFGSAETEDSNVSVNADAAFNAGAVVIIANGNSGPGPRTVTAPGNARKVLGIGAVDVETFARFPEQSEGPTGDGRVKPDLVAPTNVEVASATNNLTAVYHKTSGATAHAGGTAAVLRNFVRGSAPDVEPGHVYAGMILGGSHSGGSFDDIEGAGRLKLSPPPGTSNAIYRRFTTTNAPGTSVGVSVFITVPATTPANCRLSAALWWGEVKGAHNDYDLTLVDPNGVVRATSASGRSVFELARVGAPLTTGVWQVKVKPFKPVIGSQKVYAAVSTCR